MPACSILTRLMRWDSLQPVFPGNDLRAVVTNRLSGAFHRAEPRPRSAFSDAVSLRVTTPTPNPHQLSRQLPALLQRDPLPPRLPHHYAEGTVARLWDDLLGSQQLNPVA
ncbi:hypothetical protein AAFF_G00049270 [Aldrovandia affinis]|uniref:Uncharacterized protein n=1 Tax=Aldrovandia affinis TaxID=143900 RepID=A0AAD7WEK2_9TELE|nr:hypothetical protein AAFF_G00049270 [Aldrovandia affinis]